MTAITFPQLSSKFTVLSDMSHKFKNIYETVTIPKCACNRHWHPHLLLNLFRKENRLHLEIQFKLLLVYLFCVNKPDI